jgi:protein involved in polysaccharide export with SLBB domain
MKYSKNLFIIAVGVILISGARSGAQFNFQIPARSSEVELFSVSIQGAGLKAGTYYVPPALRVFDILKMSSPGDQPDFKEINSRSVTIITDSSIDTVDLLKYLNRGDMTQNPFVNAGMMLQITYAIHYVQIHGEIQGSIIGRTPFLPGETAGDLLSLFTFKHTADSSNILLKRESGEINRFTFKDLSTVPLKDNDFITVLPKKDVPRQASVKISGEVAIPGIYPITHGKTTVKEIIDQAQGASLNGDLKRAYLLRKTNISRNPAAASFLSGENTIRPQVTASLNYLAASHDFAIIPATINATPLEDGDEIVVPLTEKSIYVSGAVKNPGAYPFTEYNKSSYYIDLAGGYSRFADKRNVKVIKPYTDQAFSINSPHHLAAGDIIMIPEAHEDAWVRRWTPLISTLATLVSSAGIIITLSRN